MFRNSLRARLTLWYTVVLTIVLAASAAVSYSVISRSSNRAVDESLQNAGAALAAAVVDEAASDSEDPDEPQDVPASKRDEVVRLVRTFRLGDFGFLLFDDTRHLVAANSGDGADDEAFGTAPQVRALVESAAVSGESLGSLSDYAPGVRIYAVRTSTDAGTFTVIASHSLENQARQLAEVRRGYAIAIPFAVLLAALGGSLLARKSLAPVLDIGDQAERIEAASLHERLHVANEHDEIGRLARIINALLGRLEASFDQQRRFMADASHELRTPVAIVRGEAEVALSRKDREATAYRESIGIIHGAGRRLTAIVDDLFLLARVDANERRLVMSDFYLDEVVSDSVRAMRSLAERRGVDLACEPTEEMFFSGDEVLVRRLLGNLLDNAIKYTAANGKVLVRMRRTGDEYVLTVTDTGCGVPEEARNLVFERFYRVDNARARPAAEEAGGAGLGLSIARWIANAHGGRVELVASEPPGSTFAVSLPIPDGTE